MTLTSSSRPTESNEEANPSSALNQICRHAASLVLPGMTVGIAGGYLAARLARQLQSIPDVTVVTNSVDVATVLSEASPRKALGPEVIVLPGQFSEDRAILGPLSVDALQRLYLDLVFLSAQGFDARSGSFSGSVSGAEVDRAFVASSRRTAALADSARWSMRLQTPVGSLRGEDIVITDALLQESDRADAARAGIRLVIAGFIPS
jgi:DeoR/GlpR family transcriptional regulator of sugar metabolism